MTTQQFCKNKLLEMKTVLINQMHAAKNNFNLIDKARGDESDQALAHQEEHSFLITQSRIKNQLQEIEFALSRLEKGTFGICEETFEPIEADRLMAIPWTRLSIEGAEIREATSRSIAKNSARKYA